MSTTKGQSVDSRRPSSGSQTAGEERDSNVCVVCRENTGSGGGGSGGRKWIFAVGLCDHWVCYQCCTRMRVLCQQNECPICRQQLDQVIFTLNKQKKFEEFDLKKCLYRNDFGIHFEDESSLEAYGKLLEHPCRKCRQRSPFKTIHDLTTHLRKEHELFFCDLCVQNLKVFTSERKYYNRKELARHRKSGDPDERSHRGHPICTFCDERYVDEDDLHLHLRREHFYCHFCDPSGLKQFYADYRSLRQHFMADHYLCRECDEQQEKFTNAFKSEIDLQAHITQRHSQHMSKSELKNAKKISIDMFIHQRSGQLLDNGQQTRKQIKKDLRRNPQTQQLHNNITDRHTDPDMDADESAGAAGGASRAVPPPPPPAQPPGPQDFPSLSQVSDTILKTRAEEGVSKQSKTKSPTTYSKNLSTSGKPNTANDDDFPALPGGGTIMTLNTSINYNTFNKMAKPKTASRPYVEPNVCRNVQLIDSASASMASASVPSVAAYRLPSNKPIVNTKEEFPSLPVAKKKANAMAAAAVRTAGNSSLKSSSAYNTSNSFSTRNGGPTIDWFSNGNTGSTSSALHTDSSSNSNNSKSGQKTAAKSKTPKLPPTIEDFPVLETKSNKKTNFSMPIKTNNNNQSKSGAKQQSKLAKNPPPGLPAVQKKVSNLSLSSVAQEVIITTATGDHSLANDCNDNYYYFINPEDFMERNGLLVREVERVLNDTTKFLLFKEISKQFRQSAVSGAEYYEKCLELFGRKKFLTIFTELMVLLPDIDKQNELLDAQRRDHKATRGAIPKTSTAVANGLISDELVVCATCRQVLIVKDHSHHLLSH